MTDNDIIKALECCYIHSNCNGCPQEDKIKCLDSAGRNALDLIKRQKAEIERLQNYYLSMQSTLAKMSTGVEQAKAESIKAFAKRLQAKAQFSEDFGDAAVSYDDIDNLVKEMTEGGKTNEH